MNKGLEYYSYGVTKLSAYKNCEPEIALNKLLKRLTYDDGAESIYIDKMELAHDIKLSLYKICDKERLDDICICDDDDCSDFYYSVFTYHYEMNQYMSKLKLDEVNLSKNEIDIINKYNEYKLCKRK